MAVALDAKGTEKSSSTNVTTTGTYSGLTVGSVSNQAAVFAIVFGNVITSPTATCNGNSCSLILLETTTGLNSIALFGITGLASGAVSFSASWTTSCPYEMAGVSFSGVNQTGGATSFPNAAGNGSATAHATYTQAITTASGNYTVGACQMSSGGSAMLTCSPGTNNSVFNDTTQEGSNGIGCAMGIVASTTSSTTWTGTNSPNDAGVICGCDVLAAASSGPPAGVQNNDLIGQGLTWTRKFPEGYGYSYRGWEKWAQLTTSVGNPFVQSDWPNPRPVIWYQTWTESGNTNLPFPTPFLPFDWPNPRAYPRALDYTWIETGNVLLPRPTPFLPLDQSLPPRAYPRLPDYFWYDSGNVQLPFPTPFIPFDWPLPKTFSRPDFTWIESGNVQLPKPFQSFPFVQSDWPVAKSIAWYRSTEESGNSLTTVVVTGVPFAQLDWPLPKTRSPIDQFYSQSLINNTLAFVLMPFSNTWELESTAQPIDQTWINNLSLYFPTAVLSPFVQSDWPNPLRTNWYQNWIETGNVQPPFPTPFIPIDWQNPKVQRWYEDWSQSLVNNLPPPALPFNQTNWPNPYSVQWYKDYYQALALLFAPTAVKPFNQQDWPIPKGQSPIDQTWFQALAALFPPPPPVPPVISAGRQITESELNETIANWSKKYWEYWSQNSTAQQIKDHYSTIGKLGAKSRWDAKPPSGKR